MKLAPFFLCLFATATIAVASLFSYPNNKKPAISLKQACEIAEAMLRARGAEKRFHITEVSLFGDESQSGDGAWNLIHYDPAGNKINAYIPLRKPRCGLHYYPHNYSKKGGDIEYEFLRDGVTVTPI